MHKPSGPNRRISSLQECIFDNMALCFGCRINKNALFQTFFADFALYVVVQPTFSRLYLYISSLIHYLETQEVALDLDDGQTEATARCKFVFVYFLIFSCKPSICSNFHVHSFTTALWVFLIPLTSISGVFLTFQAGTSF